MTGIGSDIWRGGDNMLYLYEEVVGDFEATASFSSISWGNAGAWGKTGLMARPSCHDDARNDHILFNNVTTNEQASGGARHAHRLFDRSYSAAGRTDPCGNDPWNEPYVIGPEGMNPHGSIPGRPSANEGQDFLLDKPQHLKIIRIDDLIQSYVSWDDPDEPGEPAHWIHVASLNLVGRQDAHTVGMGMNSSRALCRTKWSSSRTSTRSPTALCRTTRSPDLVGLEERQARTDLKLSTVNCA